MGYLEELEKQWEANKRKKNELPARPLGLRGTNFVRELGRLWILTKDLRFLDAIVALDEYGIVDDSFDFIPGWVPKDLAELEKKRDQAIIDTIDHLVSRGKPVRRAVAMLA